MGSVIRTPRDTYSAYVYSNSLVSAKGSFSTELEAKLFVEDSFYKEQSV
jgi:hypothetical protein